MTGAAASGHDGAPFAYLRSACPSMTVRLTSDSPEQKRSIGPWGALSIVAGSMLGVGIFLSPGEMAKTIANPWVFLAIWAVTGLIVLGGAGAYAELGARFPKAGGDYVFHREVFGPSVGFATGFALFGAIFSGSIAAVAVALCQYQVAGLTGWDLSAPLFSVAGFAISRAQGLAALAILVLTALNASGIKQATFAQQALTLLPLAALVGVGLYALATWSGPPVPPAQALPVPEFSINGLVTAYLAAYFAYSGWNAVTYVAGEVSEPHRNIPRALVGGTALVMGLYLLLCGAFVKVLGLAGLAAAPASSFGLAGLMGWSFGDTLMTWLVLYCLLATLNASILGGGRVACAMANDGVFWRRAGQVDAQTGVPRFALWLQAAWSVTLVLSNRFDALLQAVSLTMVVTGSVTVLALFALRARRAAPSPYRALLFPWLPALYLLASSVVVVVKLREAFVGVQASQVSLLGLGIVLLAFTAHAVWRRTQRVSASTDC